MDKYLIKKNLTMNVTEQNVEKLCYSKSITEKLPVSILL